MKTSWIERLTKRRASADETAAMDAMEMSRPSRRVPLPLLVGAVIVTALITTSMTWWLARTSATVAGVPSSAASNSTSTARDNDSEPGGHANELPPGVVELTETAQQNAGVQTARASAGLLPASIALTGSVAADDARVAHVRPLARGLIERVWVRPGDRVTRGQPLVTYDNIALGDLIGQYLVAKAQLRQAQTELEVTRKALDRGRELIALEAIARQTLDLREAEFRNAEASVARERASLARVEEQIHRFGLSDAALDQLSGTGDGAGPHRDASHSILRAPIDGIVTKFDVAQGEVVEPERELFTISDLSSVWVLADVYEKDLAKVRRDAVVTMRVDAYPDRAFNGRVTHISDLIDPATRSAKMRSVVSNADGALKLDMFARVAVATSDRRRALLVPVSALQQIEDSDSESSGRNAGSSGGSGGANASASANRLQAMVFIRQSPTLFMRRNVRPGAQANGLVEILDGLTDRDEVVTAGSFYLKTALQRDRIGDEH